MMPAKLKALRLKLRNVLWRCFPQADGISIGQAVDRLVPLIVRESFNVVEMEHDRDCACWDCLLALNAAVAEHQAWMRAARQAAEEHD
jgi:hypothetical protein